MAKVKKVFHLSLSRENNNFTGHDLLYKIIQSSEVDNKYFQKAEEKRRTIDDMDSLENYFLGLNPRYPFYDSFDSFTTNTNLFITNKLKINHVTQGLCNELPLVITQFATDFRNRAVIEVEMEEKTDQEYNFNFRNTYFQISFIGISQNIEKELMEKVKGLYYGTIQANV